MNNPRTTVLFRVEIIRREEKHVPMNDQRRRVNYVLAEYAANDGERYRKAFRSYEEPIVPNQGSHEALNSLAYQGELALAMA